MLTPIGYYPFSALLDDAFANNLYLEAEKYLLEQTKTIYGLAVKRRDDLIRYWVFEYCAKQVFVCGPNGQILHLDESVLAYNTFFVDISASPMSGEGMIVVPKDIRDDFSFCEPLSEATIDGFNALVDTYNDSDSEADRKITEAQIANMLKENIEIEGQTRPSLFFGTLCGKIDLRLYDYLSNTGTIESLVSNSRELRLIASSLRNVEGWTLAVPRSLIGKPWDDFCKDRAVKYSKYLDGFRCLEEATIGRPRKRELAAQTFNSLYPMGLESDSWVQAAHRVSKITGESVSVDTLKRGLGKK